MADEVANPFAARSRVRTGPEAPEQALCQVLVLLRVDAHPDPEDPHPEVVVVSRARRPLSQVSPRTWANRSP